MKWIFCLVLLAAPSLVLSQTPDSQAQSMITPTPSPATSPTPAIAQNPPNRLVAIPADTAPPMWVEELLQSISGLPIVGPYVAKLLVYLQVLGGILSALVTFLLVASSALKGASNWTGLDGAVGWIEAFQKSKVMYWLTAFSNIPVHITPAQAAAPPSGQAPPPPPVSVNPPASKSAAS